MIQDRLPRLGAYVITSNEHIALAQRACRAGANILQYRDKNSTRKQMVAVALHLREITGKHNTIFIINDFVDVALIVGADGVHLGQDDIPIGEARRIAPPDFIIGCSTHSLEQAVTAEAHGADYIGIGPVYATPTKEDYSAIGIDTVKRVLRQVHIPVVAIGGLTPANIQPLREMGVNNFAMVRAFQQDTESVIKEINRFLKTGSH